MDVWDKIAGKAPLSPSEMRGFRTLIAGRDQYKAASRMASFASGKGAKAEPKPCPSCGK